jgi:hypothetical protein
MGKVGRKTWEEEFNLKQRYAELSVPFFNFIKEMFENGDKNDKKWAAEQLSKAYTRMIPQTLEGSEDKPLVIQIAGEVKDKYNAKTNEEAGGDSEGQA